MNKLVVAAVGVPEIVPLAVSSVKPAGKVPLATDQVYGGVPPAVIKLCEYVVPVIPLGSRVEVIEIGLLMLMESVFVAVSAIGCVLSVICTVKELLPGAVGVPEINPELESVSPAGKTPLMTDHVYGVVPPFPVSDVA